MSMNFIEATQSSVKLNAASDKYLQMDSTGYVLNDSLSKLSLAGNVFTCNLNSANKLTMDQNTTTLGTNLDISNHTLSNVADPVAAQDAVNLRTLQSYQESYVELVLASNVATSTPQYDVIFSSANIKGSPTYNATTGALTLGVGVYICSIFASIIYSANLSEVAVCFLADSQNASLGGSNLTLSSVPSSLSNPAQSSKTFLLNIQAQEDVHLRFTQMTNVSSVTSDTVLLIRQII